MMKILISNDDGVNALGLKVLAEALAHCGEITVVAPERDRSAASNSLTLDRPLSLSPQANGFYAVNGTPTDSVHIALTGWLESPPDMVISGINKGANLGDDVLYSGTVAAAMEGRFLGYPAIAISLVGENEVEGKFTHYDTAGAFARFLLENLLKEPIPAETILNINVPDRPISQIQGIMLTRLGHRHIAEKILKIKDPRGKTVYWIGPAGKEQDCGEGTDFFAVNHGYISITPIKTDLTDYKAISTLAAWAKNLHFTKT